MRLIGYTRSSDRREQAESHQAQAAKLRSWARQHGHQVVLVVSEPAGTKGTTADRVGWADVLNALHDGKADGVVVRELERLARDVMVQEQLMRDVWAQGREVLSTATSEQDLRDDPEDPTRKLLRIVIGAVHAHNRDMTVLRLARGKRRKAQAGGFVGGRPPFGWRVEGTELVEDSGEQATLARILELHGAGESLRAIAAQLDQEQRPARGGGTWHPNTLARIIARASA